MDIKKQEALDYHNKRRLGKIEVVTTKPCYTSRELSLAYTSGVAETCREIEKNDGDVYKYTAKERFPFSQIKGDANVLIFPDINSGNIAYKLMKYVTIVTIIGPVLMGMKNQFMYLKRINS